MPDTALERLKRLQGKKDKPRPQRESNVSKLPVHRTDKTDRSSAPVHPVPPADIRERIPVEDRVLLVAGYQPEERCGKTIWQRPDTGFYVGTRMAYILLSGGVRAPGSSQGIGNEGTA